MAIHYILLTFGLLFGLQAYLFRRLSLKRISYDRNLSVRACFQGEEIELVEQIENRKWFPVPWLRVESQLPTGLRFHAQANFDVSTGSIYQNHKSIFSLMPLTKITRRHGVTCTKRGFYRLDSVTLTAGDLFGLIRESKRIALHRELLVYPKPLLPEDWELPSHSWMGEAVVRRWIVDDPFLIAGTREYRYGDPLKGVNWNATARTGKLQVHRRDYSADHRLMIILNVEDHEGMWSVATDDTLVEHGLSCAAGLAQQAVDFGMEAGFAANAAEHGRAEEASFIEPGGGEPHLTAIYEAMARLKTERLLPLHELLHLAAERLDGKTDCIILTPYENDRIRSACERLEARGHAVRILRFERPQAPAEAEVSA